MLPCYHIYEIVSAIVAEEPYWIQQEPKGFGVRCTSHGSVTLFTMGTIKPKSVTTKGIVNEW